MVKTQPDVTTTRDDLAADLLNLIKDCEQQKVVNGVVINKDLLMQKLCSYIVRRDHTIHNHAYHLGKAANGNQNHKSNKEK